MRCLEYRFGLLFEGNTPEELAQAIENHLNPKPMIKEQPKKKAAPRRR